MKLNTKKVHDYVQKHQKDLASLKLYFAKCSQNSINSGKTIIQINEEIKKNLKSINDHKQTVKTIKQYAQNNQQRQACQKNTEYIKNKINNWINVCEGILDKVKENMRLIDSKNQKKLLSQQQLTQFKTFFTQSILSFQQNISAIVQHFATEQINSNCILLESLTNRMQRLGNK